MLLPVPPRGSSRSLSAGALRPATGVRVGTLALPSGRSGLATWRPWGMTGLLLAAGLGLLPRWAAAATPAADVGAAPAVSPAAPPPLAAAPAAPTDAAAAAGTPPPAPAPLSPPAGPGAPRFVHAGVLSSTNWGGRGVAGVASAYPLTRRAFTLSVRADFFRTRRLLAPGDTDTESGQSIHVAYSPVTGLELALSEQSQANSYTNKLPRNLQLQGNPTLRVKYGHHVAGPLALGVLGSVTLPSVQGNAGAMFRAANFTVQGLLSLQLLRRLEVSGNLGFAFNRNDKAFRGVLPDTLQRFAFRLDDTQSGLWGVSATGRISAGKIDLLPFGAIQGQVGTSRAATTKTNPVRASVGLRGYPGRNRAVEIALGSDVRVAGAPRDNSPFAGLPPWRVFAQVTVHLGEGLGKGAAAQTPAERAALPRLRGQVSDAATGLPLPGAQVHLEGDDNALLYAVDEQTGSFVTAPLAGAGTLHITAKAPGYQSAEQDVALPGQAATGEGVIEVPVTLQLVAEGQGNKMALLKGTIQDAERGEPVPGATVYLPALRRNLPISEAGGFSVLLKPGRYRVWINAAGYKEQRKLLPLRVGESMVLSVDLVPEEGGLRTAPSRIPSKSPGGANKRRSARRKLR